MLTNLSTTTTTTTTTSSSLSYEQMTEEITKIFEELPAGLLIGMGIACLVIAIIGFIVYWKIFTKAGEAGWKCLIPIYNTYILTKIATGSGVLFLLLLIPVVDIVFMVWLYLQLAKSFGKSTGFGIGLVFLTLIFECILAFGSAQYVGPKGQI